MRDTVQPNNDSGAQRMNYKTGMTRLYVATACLFELLLIAMIVGAFFEDNKGAAIFFAGAVVVFPFLAVMVFRVISWIADGFQTRQNQ
jgi:hypothetical protein